jgi:hypothetical protein
LPTRLGSPEVRESTSVGCVSVDSAWLRFSSSPESRKAARNLTELKSPWSKKLQQERHVNIVAGRATFTDRAPRLYAYVHKQVPSAAGRLDQFLCASGVRPDERVTVITDDAGEFGKAVEGSQLARGRIRLTAAESRTTSACLHPAGVAWTGCRPLCLSSAP